MIRVEKFTGRKEEWDTFAAAQGGYTHFHRLGWRAVIERTFGHECVYLAARNAEGELAGVLPLVRVRSVVFGHYLVSMPFLNYGGPLGTDAGICALVDEAIDLAGRDRVRLLEMRSNIPLRIGLPVSHRKITVFLDLPRTPEVLLQRFGAKLRSQIRRPQKEGVSVVFGRDPGDADAVAQFFSPDCQRVSPRLLVRDRLPGGTARGWRLRFSLSG